MFKEIIILAKSFKRDNYCIAGIELETGKWIRPISTDDSIENAVPINKLRYSNNEELGILDIVKIKFDSCADNVMQPENWYYTDDYIWEKIGKSTVENILQIHPFDSERYVFVNANNNIDVNSLSLNNKSLILISTKSPIINIYRDDYTGNLKCKLSFEYNNFHYSDISVTDPSIIKKYKTLGIGRYKLSNNLPIVFSLTNAFNGKYYKLAVQFFVPNI